MRAPKQVSPTLLVCLVIGLLLSAASEVEAAKSETKKEKSEACLECHEEADDVVTFADGSKLKTAVDPKKWSKSVHAKKLSCNDCHRDITDHPHPKIRERTKRGYQLQRAKTCRRCHYAYYTRVLDSIHYKRLKAGKTDAPSCVDCHGAHETPTPKARRLTINRRCGNCHGKILKTYAKSVHGVAFTGKNTRDVPVCTDCHGAHAIRDPRRTQARVNVHLVCARCHSDAARMKKYDLNPNVTATYLDDFHGKSNSLYAKGAGTPKRAIASCVDCHGIHDIKRFSHAGDKEAVRRRIVPMCQRCHKGATPAFADTWLSHYQPTLASAPLVWLVKQTYRVLIPTIIVALILHILLHLWRIRIHRNKE